MKDKIKVINFNKKISEVEREVEAILFAAEEPLDIESIKARTKKSSEPVLSSIK